MQTAPLTSTLLGGRSPAEFLEDYWQKKPLVIRGALPDFTSPLAPEELAGLALEEGVTSRLILEEEGDYPWQLKEGPFEEDDFLGLPETHWTLLVQEVDRLIPEVGALLEHFRFLPRWRIDDIMVSYAPEGGTVGAHIDHYDVFLLQGLGHREWQIGHAPVEDASIVPDLDVRILADFEPDETMVLEPGDMLYLPPRVAHHGIALDDCMTYSVGFRAPDQRALVGDFLSFALEQMDLSTRFRDPGRAPATHPGRLRPDDRRRVRMLLQDVLDDEEAINRWFGQFATRPRRDQVVTPRDEPYAPEDVKARLEDGALLRHGPASRLAFIEDREGTVHLFVNGEEIMLSPDLGFAAPLLADHTTIPSDALRPHLSDAALLQLITQLVNEGALEVAA